MSIATEYVKAHSGGGRFYLSAKMLVAGMTGTIAESPYTEMAQFGNEPEKELFRLPVDLDRAVTVTGKRGNTSRTDALFSPGTNAVQLLLDDLGEDVSKWAGRRGHFEQRTIGSWAPWCFVPDKPGSLTSNPKAPAASTATARKRSTKTSKATSKPSFNFSCGMCPQTFSSITELQTHIGDVH